MKIKRKSVSFRFALRFSILLTILSLLIAFLITESLWLTIRNDKAKELINAANIIERAIESGDDEKLNSGFPSLPYYIDYIIYSADHATYNESYNVISSNNPYLPHLPETLGSAKIYREDNYYIDGNLYILYYAKKINFFETAIIIQTSANMETDSSSNVISTMPKILLFALVPVFLLCFFISMYITKRTLKPVEIITKKAQKIKSTNLDTLLPVRNTGDEFDTLAQTFNDLFKRLKSDFDRERQFTSDVSHELRTPVAVISGQSNLLRRWGKDDPKQLEKSLGIIITETKSMENIISILLQMSRLECGKITPEYSEVNLNKFFERLAIETTSINPNAKLEYDKKINLTFTTDEELLHQVFTVVISNSIKFVGDGVVIKLSHYMEKKHHCFEIEDNGPGFQEKIIPFVFERFYRGDDSHSRAAGGSGLGLSIAKTIINSMGGIISAHNSKNGGGAVIKIQL